MSMHPDQRTIAETAEFLRSLGHSYVVPETIRYMIRVGKIKAVKTLNRRWLISSAELERFLQDQKEAVSR
jgi:predicted site-specific integrase-resolvase